MSRIHLTQRIKMYDFLKELFTIRDWVRTHESEWRTQKRVHTDHVTIEKQQLFHKEVDMNTGLVRWRKGSERVVRKGPSGERVLDYYHLDYYLSV